ncbi:MAG: hypothetical protein V1809_14265 [Planctomycetota bacterium]
MSAKNIWLGNERWPGNKSCGDFARDVFRLARAKTDKRKALAFYDWLTRCLMRGANLQLPNGAGGYSRCYEPLVLLASWGHGECTFWGWIATECLCAAGLKARRVVAHNNGHTFYEVWYTGDDGRGQWHAFDPFIGWFFLNERGEVASCEELAANPRLVQDPLPGHPVPLGHHPERSGIGHRHRLEDQVFIEQPMRNDVNAWELQKGMEVAFNFMPEVSGEALFEKTGDGNPVSSHCDIAELNRGGFVAQPKHMPYWKNYLWPTENTDGLNEGRPVRWHGAGALRWTPLKHGKTVVEESHNAKFENGILKLAGRHDFAEVWYHFKLPYLVSRVVVDYDVVGSGGDYFGLSLSADGGRTIWPMKLKANAPHYGVARNGRAQRLAGEPSVQGLREFWLRVDFSSHASPLTFAVQALRISVGFQHNMHLQPRLLPGANPIWLEAGKLDSGDKLQAEWIFQKNGKEERARLELAKAGKVSDKVNLKARCPSEILMTGIRLTCM